MTRQGRERWTWNKSSGFILAAGDGRSGAAASTFLVLWAAAAIAAMTAAFNLGAKVAAAAQWRLR